VTVTEGNTRPILTPVPDQTIIEGRTLTLTNIATDTDVPANTLAFSLVSAPGGVQLNTNNGVLTWTPTEAQGPGVYTISVKVADNGNPPLSDTRSFTVNVTESNSPPVLLVPVNQTIAELATLNVSAFSSDSDVPANTRTFGFVNAPDGMSIDPVTGAIGWTPSEAQGPGTYTVAVKVTDNGSPPVSTTNSFQVTVSEVNTPPVSTPVPLQTIAELATLTIPITTTDNDLPANKLSYSLASGPSGVNVNSTTGILTWTPTEAQGPGNYNISVVITDDGTPPLFVTNSFSVNVVE